MRRYQVANALQLLRTGMWVTVIFRPPNSHRAHWSITGQVVLTAPNEGHIGPWNFTEAMARDRSERFDPNVANIWIHHHKPDFMGVAWRPA